MSTVSTWCRKQIKYNMLNNDEFIDNVTLSTNNYDLPMSINDVDECITKVSDVLYNCAQKSRIKRQRQVNIDNNQQR